MLSLDKRREWAIAAGMRLETITAILARRRRCSQVTAVQLSKAAKKIGLHIRPEVLALNLFWCHPIYREKPQFAIA